MGVHWLYTKDTLPTMGVAGERTGAKELDGPPKALSPTPLGSHVPCAILQTPLFLFLFPAASFLEMCELEF